MSRTARVALFAILFASFGSVTEAQEYGCALTGGFLQYSVRGQDTNNWTARALCGLSSAGNSVFIRGQLMRTQDASDTTLKTIKSIELYAAVDRVLGPVSVGALCGTFFDVDAKVSPRDPEQWTYGGYLKRRIKGGYVLAGVGKVAAVGGLGAFSSLALPKKGDITASFVMDFAIPFSRAGFAKDPYVITSGVLLGK